MEDPVASLERYKLREIASGEATARQTIPTPSGSRSDFAGFAVLDQMGGDR
jgi:hypothetical protein